MILADILNLSIVVVIIAHVVVSALLILVVMMQRPKQEGLGAAFGAGMTDGMWGARTTDVLQKGTVYLGTLFFIFALLLAILVGKSNARDGARADQDLAVVSKDKTESVEETQQDDTLTEAEKMASELEEASKNSSSEVAGDKGSDDQEEQTASPESGEEKTPESEEQDAPN